MALTETIDIRGGILVGHDGSAAATSAVRTALRCADVFGPHVQVVRAWTLPTAETPSSYAPGYMPSYEAFEAATLQALERDVAQVAAEYPDAEIACSVVHGNASHQLIDASSRVELIVVGGRGHGGFAGLLLGSVTDQVVRHARCGVLVDRAATTVEPEEGDQEQLQRALVSELKLVTPK